MGLLKYRWVQGPIIAVAIIGFIFLMLLWAQSAQVGKVDDLKVCAPFLRLGWLGCAMAAHENLAGGLIGCGGALFAGWLAWSAVRDQIAFEKRRDRAADQRIAERKEIEKENTIRRLTLLYERLTKITTDFESRLKKVGARDWPHARAFLEMHEAGRLHTLNNVPIAGDLLVKASNEFLTYGYIASAIQKALAEVGTMAFVTPSVRTAKMDDLEKEVREKIALLKTMAEQATAEIKALSLES